MIIAAIAISTAISAAAQAQAAQATEAQGKAQQQMHEYNARMQEAEGRNRERAAQIEEARIADQQKGVLGKQKTQFAKQGFSIEEGASIDVMADTYGEFAIDRSLTLRKGLIDEMTLKSEANISRYKGRVANQYGQNMKRAGYLGMAGTIVGGAASAYSAYSSAPAKGVNASNSGINNSGSFNQSAFQPRRFA